MIVALENASSDPSIALAAPDGSLLAIDGWSGGVRQGSELLPRLLALLEREGLQLRQATAVVVGIGPGSFTGLRVALSLAKGLVLALEVPVVGIPSLHAWLAAEPTAAVATSRAGARDGFLLIRGEADPRIVPIGEVRTIIAARRVVAPAELAAAAGIVDSILPHRAAAAVAEAAVARLAAEPMGDDPERLEPSYLRAPPSLGPAREVVAWP
jgi:tRNA threonylcarbamoyl adenosine modification protein YeaZ